MQITISPTEDFFMFDDVMVRMWRGATDGGAPIFALVAGVVAAGEPVEGLRLVSIPPPDQEAAGRWAHKILSGAPWAEDGDG
jgi:hypothetical protein